jgi:hypothetical protein
MSPELLKVVERHESHQRRSRMVEISLSGSGEGPGKATTRGYSTTALERTKRPGTGRDLGAKLDGEP